jgi:quercetin dioxygenase-like cupin family protein
VLSLKKDRLSSVQLFYFSKEAAMKRTIVMLALMLAVGFVMGVITERLLIAQGGPNRTILLKTDMEGLPGKEANMTVVEFAPGVRTGKHYHPGYEFGYVLEGHGVIEKEGKPAVELKPGVPFYNFRSDVHEGRNLSQTEPMKLLVIYITDKGNPITVPVNK